MATSSGMGKERESTSLKMLLDQQPDRKELNKHARTSKWRQLGEELELDSVDLDGCTDLTSMYRLWIQEKAEMATRRNLLTALRSIRENDVARQYENYLKTKATENEGTLRTTKDVTNEHVTGPSENTIELILDKRPDKKHLVDLLAKNANEYKKFAIALDVDRGFVKGLSGDDNVEKLDEIIGKWMTTRSTPITWRTIIEVVKGDTLGNNEELAEKIMNWLEKEKNFDYYLKQ